MRPAPILVCAVLLAAAPVWIRAQSGAVGAQGGTAQPSAPAPRQGGATSVPPPQGGGGAQGRGAAGRGRAGGDGGGQFGGLGRLGRGGGLNREPVLGTA